MSEQLVTSYSNALVTKYTNARTVIEYDIVTLSGDDRPIEAFVVRPDAIVRENVEDVHTKIADAIAGRAPCLVVIDGRETVYIDSTGLGLLVRLARELRAQGNTLVIVGLNDDLTTLFQLTKLDLLLDVYSVAVWRGRVLEGEPL
jgi:anti-sigma B factor antagonist